ncbi:zinc finger and SCAN domain-containing protein 12-like [Sitodiplosis mosellana]|uniref:zinc finger and SCAN domain-containing protein 12-like n=1 Tax=Sitodiplosis mosellana TaxID=263140 RepID=UPI002443B4BD|nr:zinc finger and SCAN domain-containing protein 12-like [Sitodiplosis mosellana]
MTSITNKSAHSAVSASLKSADMSVIKNRSNMNESDLQAELIEVVPELPFNDSDEDDDFSEYSDDEAAAAAAAAAAGLAAHHPNPFHLNNMDDDDDEPFDEYAYQVMSNHSEPQTIWFDNSQLKSLPLNSSTGDSDVILIDDDDDNDGDHDDSDDDFNENSNGGLTHEPSDNLTEQKMYSCDICHSKLSSSYNLKRHKMIHSGEKPFECDICKRRFREQSDLRKHKKVHNNSSTARCSVCNRNQPSSRHSNKCVSCEKQETTKRYQDSISDDLAPRTNDANNKKAFVCKYCDRTFGSSSNLKRHIMIHTGEKPFQCSECKRPFREMSTLKKHLITHRKQNGFTSATSFKSMALTESGQSPLATPSKTPTQFQPSLHKCPLCKTICRGTENLMNHITTVHRPNSNAKSNGSSENTKRKLAKSPPPLIPIKSVLNKTAFNYLNAKRI